MRQPTPIAGIALALVSFVALISLGFDFVISATVLVVWVGSLLVLTGGPPESPKTQVEAPLEREAIRRLIENSGTPVLVIERNKIALANREARRMLGLHVLGQDARVAFRQPEAASLLSKNKDGQAIVRGLVRRQDIWRLNRHSVDADTAIIELINQTSEADISKAHTDFVANASHELRTPLAAIIGYVETLRESGDSLEVPTSQKFLGTIEREAHRMQSLISDLMSLSRVEAEKHDLPETIFALGPLVRRAASDAAGPNRLDRVSIDERVVAHIQGDQQQLEQVVRNLVDNALKYGDPQAEVTVELDRARDGQARLTVSDQGEGIAPEQIPHLTRRFYRTDPGRSRASGGTGLGLAIVKHIIERHRGRLDISSKLGEGTQVIIRLPIADDHEALIIKSEVATPDTTTRAFLEPDREAKAEALS